MAQIQSHINYGFVLWGGIASPEQVNKIRKTLNMCVKILKPKTEISKSYSDLKILTLVQLIELEHNKLAYIILKGTLPIKTREIIHYDQNNKSLQKSHNYKTRQKSKPNIPRPKTNKYTKSFLCNGIRALNELTSELTACASITTFVKKCKQKYVNN